MNTKPGPRCKWAKNFRAYTITEVLIVIAIISIVGATIRFSYSGVKQRRELQSGAEQVKIDIYLMQSRAVTGLLMQRMVLVDNNTYRLEEDSTGSGDWVTTQAETDLPDDVTFSADDVSDRNDELEFSSNGFPDFNGESSDPFFTLSHAELPSRLKNIVIDVSGKVTIEGD